MKLAQLNIADARFETDEPQMHGFTSRIDAINALADRAPGFVWRMVDDGPEDGALSLRMEGHGPMTLVNMSVWESVEALYGFVYQTAHAKVMRGKADWFTPTIDTHMVLWWVEDGHIPNLDEAKAKLDRIRVKGPTPDAFSFTVPFDETGIPITPPMGRKDCA
ncbi:DUF3291 domain-containing protein [Algimonas porphyrae]|uniref:DUF3291 domain-containing protein n=1 Tax=Algimonas porphyrae TaxID=1128113 RepID=A0ABQ5UXC9_9PROT|nr:DUF3291 domain-containing protein [Algimonas porphyrae]GLQ19390.1 hypothetical protein GCM10007854_03450 [Algimonas porphyrae]